MQATSFFTGIDSVSVVVQKLDGPLSGQHFPCRRAKRRCPHYTWSWLKYKPSLETIHTHNTPIKPCEILQCTSKHRALEWDLLSHFAAISISHYYTKAISGLGPHACQPESIFNRASVWNAFICGLVRIQSSISTPEWQWIRPLLVYNLKLRCRYSRV